jgi:hypothetical protein
MSSTPTRTLALFAVLAAALTFTPGCGCGTPKPVPDGGEQDAGYDAGEADSGYDAGEPDAGEDAGPPPELKIFKVLPPRAGAAGGTQVLITGQGFVQGFATRATEAKALTTLKFGSNPSLDFQVIDDNTIDARAPAGKAGLANVSLKNGNGLFVCSACFTYYDELYLTGVTPKEGPLRGGNEVELTGQGFTADVHVLFGSLSSPHITLVDSKKLKVLVPRAQVADAVDVTVYNKNGVGSLRRVYRYRDDLAVTQVAPLFGPVAGGTSVVLTGKGFEGATAVKFGALDAASFTVDSATQVTAVAPPAAVGTVDVTVTTPVDSFTTKGAFTYVDNAAPALFAVYPHVGPAAGGNEVTLVGQGLDVAGLAVSFGGVAATVVSQSANEAHVTVPARGSGSRKVSVTATGGSLNGTLAGGYTYRLELTSIAPSRGPAAGGTVAAVVGSGLPADAQVFLGSAAALVNGAVADTGFSLTTPQGSGGAASALRVFEAADPENEAVLADAFTFDEPLSIGRVQPERGAIAGATLVTVRGAGFGDATVVTFGANHAKDVKIVDTHTLTCRTPKGDVGAVDVGVERLGPTDNLPGGFSYFDPRNISGGLSGGPLVGTLNISVLESTQGQYGLPVPLANVILGLDGTTPFQGQTDSRGQLTFSDPSLVKAQTVTVWKEGFESTTVTAVASENLTVFVARTGGGGTPSPPPPGPPPSLISGRVTGFKLPHQLNVNESLEARVFVTQNSLYGGAPFRAAPTHSGEKWLVVVDGGEYLLYSGAGLRATYAVLGVKNTQTGEFAPYLMGVRRAITTSPDNPAINQDIILDMHLDLTVPITIDSPITIGETAPGVPAPAMNNIYVWLDLGAEGFVPNPNNWGTGTSASTSVASTLPTLSFPSFPQLDGSNFIFMNFATGTAGGPLSLYFRRQPGSLAPGVTIGPMLPTPVFTQPTTAGLTGVISWVVAPGPTPDLQRVEILKQTMMGPVTLWTVVLPGTEKQVVLPPQALQQLLDAEVGSTLFVEITQTRSPKFNYAQWTYDTLLSTSAWSSFTIADSDGFTP